MDYYKERESISKKIINNTQERKLILLVSYVIDRINICRVATNSKRTVNIDLAEVERTIKELKREVER